MGGSNMLVNQRPRRARRFGSVLVVASASLLYLMNIPASGADSATVDATVTPAAPCLTVAVSSATFGTKAFSTSAGTSVALTPNYGYTNCSSIAEKVLARGTSAQNAAGTATWTLDDTALGSASTCTLGQNKYQMKNVDIFPPGSGSNQGEILLSTTPKVLNGAVAAGQARQISPQLHMPCSGSGGAGEEMNLQMLYTATF